MKPMLGNPKHRLCWPETECVRLNPPPNMSCLQYVDKLVRDAGFPTPEAAAASMADLPVGLLHVKEHMRLPSTLQNPRQIPTAWQELRTAIILGKASSVFYDPAKFLIWTEDRLSRCISLYEAKGFYERP